MEAVNILIAQRADEIVKPRADHVNLAEVVDSTKKREVPVMSNEEFDVCWHRFIAEKKRPPLPEEKPSIHQLTAVIELLRVNHATLTSVSSVRSTSEP